MRLRKKVYLPCKLVGVDGKTKIKVFEEINECSSIRWKFSFEQVPQASNKTRSIWNQFIQWLFEQNIQTIIDFSNYYSYKYYVSSDKEYACKEKQEGRIYYQKQNQ